ncbi:P450 monooxygenase [Colletotrichum orchidophilum]|uniref:p450 monooxygenase n=1 Tax=Colletotrichum orchidophilum TaxID=1209926 RepID=A0A1G4BA24_9PEZI|nr:P450 monooxygenase [Colletotrichum orchidophilum]OHE98238.1 P450 monooxygenase [Colletotrichum orchidophilum]
MNCKGDEPMTLSGGTYLLKGTLITVATHTARGSALWRPELEKFDSHRFFHMRKNLYAGRRRAGEPMAVRLHKIQVFPPLATERKHARIVEEKPPTSMSLSWFVAGLRAVLGSRARTPQIELWDERYTRSEGITRSK